MDERTILRTINTDLAANLAARVVYLEGQTDPPLFFGLLGLPQPSDGVFLHQQTLVKGFIGSDASGNKTVRAYVDVAQQNGFDGRVFGIVDGDGEELPGLAPRFDPPYAGPLFTWKAYSIESLLPQLPWPTAWGPAPAWQSELAAYAPYVAINRLSRDLAMRLQTLRLAKFLQPIGGQPLETTDEIEAALQADKGLLAGLDVAAAFGAEVMRFEAAIANSIEEGMALLNGKWLLRHFMTARLGQDPDYWSQGWVRHAESVGGLTEVRTLWQRITGTLPGT